MTNRILLLFGSSAVALMSPIGATAQRVQAETPIAAEDIAEVVVTAQKRSETLQSVPLSVTALTQKDLERRGVQSLYDVSRLAPSLAVVSSGPGENNLIVRGISSVAGSAATVGYYLDDTPIAASSNAALLSTRGVIDPSALDIARIEVLRGPQGTLYGSSSMGGDGAIWYGSLPTIGEQAAAVGVDRTLTRTDLQSELRQATSIGRRIVFPPPYRAETHLLLSELLSVPAATINERPCVDLIAVIVGLREIKDATEIAELTAALSVTAAMHRHAMGAIRPGLKEHAIVGQLEGIARGADLRLAYQPVFTARGEVLHNLQYANVVRAGDLVVHDSGVVSAGGYASDITRTLPVSGRFDDRQRKLYEAVLHAQQDAIANCRPGVRYLDLHLNAARLLVEPLIELGLFRGTPAAVVASGAYALCFQCGLGHQLGLDLHDMEALGEDHVGYDRETTRSALFGLRSLRLGKRLKTGMTLTVEPGLYFIPALIDRWRAEGKYRELIDYDRCDDFRQFGGIRIEDDVLITADGAEVLGAQIPKEVDDVESLMGRFDGVRWI